MDPVNTRLNKLIRDQLLELRIDADSIAVSTAPRTRRRLQLGRWLCDHREAAWLAAGSLVLLLVIAGMALLVASQPRLFSPATTSDSQVASTATTVSLDDLTVVASPPAYRRFADGQALLVLHLDVTNPTNRQVTLRAGDVVLVDPRGAIFPPSWHDLQGGERDGLTDPQHALLALDPGASASIELLYLTLGDGPYTVRYRHQPELATPSLTLG